MYLYSISMARWATILQVAAAIGLLFGASHAAMAQDYPYSQANYAPIYTNAAQTAPSWQRRVPKGSRASFSKEFMILFLFSMVFSGHTYPLLRRRMG